METVRGFDLRPRTIGELLDLIFRVYRRSFATFALLGVAVTSVSAVSGTLLQYALVGPENWEAMNDPERAMGALGPIYSWLGLLAAINMFIYGLGTVAITAAAEETLLGRPVGAGRALALSWPRAAWAGLASVLVAMAGMCALTCCVLPVVPVLILLSLTVSLIYLERRGPVEAMSRSYELVAKRGPRALSIESNWVRIAIVGFVTLVVVYLLNLLASLPVMIASGTAALRDGGMMKPTAFGPQLLPLHLLLPLQLVGALAQGIFLAIGIIPWTLMYYDIRIRHEGLDLELRANALGGDAPAAGP